ncbi:MAG: hypothetical protein WC928_04195 [Patescibacteria group bacterium]
MIYTKPEEIKTVIKNIKILGIKLPKSLLIDFSKPMVRLEQHGLFFTLCDPTRFPYLEKAIKSIRAYKKGLYLSKVIKKLKTNRNSDDQKSVLMEIIIFSYYCDKFEKDKHISVDFDRKWSSSSGKNVDISILGLDKPINVEICALHFNKSHTDFFNLRYKVNIEIEKRLAILSNQRYSYEFSILEGFTEKNIDAFIKFLIEKREEGTGYYNYLVNDKQIANLEIRKLNKRKKEYAVYKDIWIGRVKDDKRIRNKITEKAEYQLPHNEFNFIFVSNFAMFDDIDFVASCMGTEVWHIGKNSKIVGKSWKPDGILSILKDKKYAPIHGMISTQGFDYVHKKMIRIEAVPQEVYKILQ